MRLLSVIAGLLLAGSAMAARLTLPSVTVGSGGSILPADRDASANWRMAGLLSIGGIPTRTTICATLSPKGGGADDTGAINTALSACPAGQVVRLNAGTFTINEGSTVLVGKGVTLRGAGPTTVLTRTNGAKDGSYFPGASQSAIMEIGGSGDTAAPVALAADGIQGATSITLTSAAGFAAGQFVLLNETSGAGWQPERVTGWTSRQIWASPDYRVVWQKHNPQGPADDFGSGSYPHSSGSAGCWFSVCDRPTNEMKKIAAVSGNTITFDSPLTISYRVANKAQLARYTGMVQQAGVENLAVSYGDGGNINFDGCAYCWAANVENSHYLNGGFNLTSTFRTQLEAVYIHNAAWPVNGGAGYNISIGWGSSEVLIENSISVLANKVMVARSAGAGSVVAYNYMDDGYINGQSWVEIGLNASHMAGPHHVLFEGNYGFNADSDQTHGNSIYMTFFRNWLTGFRAPFTGQDGKRYDDSAGCCGPLRAGSAHAYAYWFSFLGNVLGTPGKMGGWAYENNGGINQFPASAIWTLGYFDVSPQGTDAQVPATTLRDGNFDYVTNSIRWAAGPHALPPSLYLSAKPAFFGTNPWPWVVPEGTPQTFVLPAKARYDAGTPNG